LAVYLPGLWTTPPIDRDEGRFAQASRQMFEAAAWPDAQLDPAFHGGGWAVPMVQGTPRLNKPPLIYWLQAGSAMLLTAGRPEHDAIWMYRVPSVLGSIAAVLATWRLGLMLFDRRAALLAGALLAVCAMVVFDAHQARADQVLLGVTAWAMVLLWSVIRRARLGRSVGWARWAGLWALVGLGVLVKGVSPVVVLLTLVTMGVLGRGWFAWRGARPLLGAAVVGVMLTPWLTAVAGHVGLERYVSIVFREAVTRGGVAQEGHGGPPGYHAAMLWVMFWPGSLLALGGLVRGLGRGVRLGPAGARWRGRGAGRPQEFFLLCWIVPTWIFFELYTTKLPHYVLPVYPALALLSARDALSGRVGSAWRRVGAALFGVVGAAVALGATAAPWVLPELDTQQPVLNPAWVLPGALVLLGLTVWGAVLGWRGQRAMAALRPALAAGVVLAWTAHAAVLPRLTGLSPKIVAALGPAGSQGRPLACAGYQEDSLVFLARGRIARLTTQEALPWLERTPGGLLVIRPQDLPEQTPPAWTRTVATVEGYHFAKGRAQAVLLLERAGGEP
jgi:4-amino-4-deoxy-L-arabinose transferase-like glycosyltransferase